MAIKAEDCVAKGLKLFVHLWLCFQMLFVWRLLGRLNQAISLTHSHTMTPFDGSGKEVF